jgi:hypothetical protein
MARQSEHPSLSGGESWIVSRWVQVSAAMPGG